VSVGDAIKRPPTYRVESDSDVWRDWRKTAGLVKQLTRRHLAARYRGSSLGFLWSLLHPLLMMVIYTIVFRYVLRISSPGVPYPVFFLTGVLAWNFFQTGALNGAISIVDNASLIHKARFPRIALPLSAVLSNGVNYLISIPVLVAFSWVFGVRPGPELLLFPLVALQLFALTLGIALIGASLTPFFRDTTQLLEIAFVAWFFATPVLYPTTLAAQNLPELGFRLYQLNPLAGAISLVRAVFFGEAVSYSLVLSSVVVAVLVLLIGLIVFRRLSAGFTTAT
jgi:ABC-type polysaccharide/polyol phosphate export permease